MLPAVEIWRVKAMIALTMPSEPPSATSAVFSASAFGQQRKSHGGSTAVPSPSGAPPTTASWMA
jgi:hypothetical protein